MIIRLLQKKDERKFREFFRLQGGALDEPSLSEGAGVAALEGEEILAAGFMKAVDLDRYELSGIAVKSELKGMGLEQQMVLTLELAAEKRRARWFGIWLKSDACDDFAYPDINERLKYVERGYVFRSYRADWFGPGRHADRLDRELVDVLESTERRHRRRLFSEN